MSVDYQTDPQTIGSRGANHCGNNGNSSLTNTNGNRIDPPLLAVYRRYISQNPQTPEERRGQIELCFLEFTSQQSSTPNCQKKLPIISNHSLILPEVPREVIADYNRVGSETRKCTNCCGTNGSYCKDLTMTMEEGRGLGRQMADLVTFRCTGMLYNPIPNLGVNQIIMTYYKQKPRTSN